MDSQMLIRKKKSIKRKLLVREDFIEKRIANLGGSTTCELRDMLEIFLLKEGIRPIFHESEYNKYYEDVSFSNNDLID